MSEKFFNNKSNNDSIRKSANASCSGNSAAVCAVDTDSAAAYASDSYAPEAITSYNAASSESAAGAAVRERKRRIKPLSEQTFKNNFMFCAVMSNESICREFLEMILGIEVSHIEVCKEKCFIYNPVYKGVRLDVFVKGDDGKHYDIDLQVSETPIELRTRYYHSQMDMEMLETGEGYDELAESYVIFICDYDPLGYNKYVYTIQSCCEETDYSPYNDGIHTILLSTKGENESEIPSEILKFLKFVSADLKDSDKDFGSSFVRRLQDRVDEIRLSRIMNERYSAMIDYRKVWEKEAREEGLAEGKLEKLFSLYQKGILSYETVLNDCCESDSERASFMKMTKDPEVPKD
ncbi:MAG: Rpn family recombination-promoting nuclease/putative transposase [Clostridiales bacterium]|nr:Rpn family recombination-promoting nuclease/putative transposase [Clostridiales bacterium]